jgi:hypothetical protein
MKKVVLLFVIIFMLAVPMASAESLDDFKTPKAKADYISALMDKYSALIKASKENPDVPSCKQIEGWGCIPYTDIYNGLAVQFTYYASQE